MKAGPMHSGGCLPPLRRGNAVNTQGPVAFLWVTLGLTAFYIALIWLNTLLPMFLIPLFIVPLTWLLERLGIGRPSPATDGKSTQQRG